MLHDKKKQLLVAAIDQIKEEKKKQYQRSYEYIYESMSQCFKDEIERRSLQNNKEFLDDLEKYRKGVYKLHFEILDGLEKHAEVEKKKLELMSKEELDDIHPRGAEGFEKYLERRFDNALYESSNRCQVRFEIDQIIGKLKK
jgi:hypothetical protein